MMLNPGGGLAIGTGATEPDHAAPRRPLKLSDLVRPHVAGVNRRRGEVLLVALAVRLAWGFRFAQDDAFITYRYARNLARGEGLVFNPGERVEGYTNFLWTVLHAIPERLGWSSPVFSSILGCLALAGLVVVTNRLARRVLVDDALAWLATAALVLNGTMIGYGTSGLETGLQTLLLTSTTLIALRMIAPPSPMAAPLGLGHALAAGALIGLALLVRLDSAAYLAALGVGVLIEARRHGRLRALLTPILGATLTTALIVGPWLWWKVRMYGSVVPNTAIAKDGASPWWQWGYGLFYLAGFLASYGAVLLLGRLWRHRRMLPASPGGLTVVIVIAGWMLYVVAVGSDFMEYRFMVPVLPLAAMVLVTAIDRILGVVRHTMLVGALVALSLFHLIAPSAMAFPVLPFAQLRHWPTESRTSWQHMGTLLAEAFPGRLGDPGRPVIAISAAGVIPYVSDLETIDMLGLTDAETARNGTIFPVYYPGHVRTAEVPYLQSRGVSLIVGHPTMVPARASRTGYRFSELVGLAPGVDLRALPEGTTVIEVPLDDRTVWPILRLGRSDAVDHAVESRGWRELPVERTCDPADTPDPITSAMARSTC